MNLKRIFDRLPKIARRQKLARLLLKLSPQSKIQLVEFNGNARLYADITDSFPLNYFLTRYFDQDYLNLAAHFLKGGGVFIDAGANFGFCTFGLIGLIPDAPIHYYLFEANSEIVTCLRRSAALHPEHSITIIEGILADKAGRSSLKIIPRQLGSSHMVPSGRQQIPHILLDDFIEREGIPTITFMKLDIEGSEPLALQGCSRSLQSGKIKVLYFEVTHETLSRFNWAVDSFLDLVRSYGYELFFVRPIDFQRVPEIQAHTRHIKINGDLLRVSPVLHYPLNLETDLIAFHKSFQFP